jgi:hypothetical protein
MPCTFKQVGAGQGFYVSLPGKDAENTRVFEKLSDPIVATNGLQIIKVGLDCVDDQVVNAAGDGTEVINAIGPYGKFASFSDDVPVCKLVR